MNDHPSEHKTLASGLSDVTMHAMRLDEAQTELQRRLDEAIERQDAQTNVIDALVRHVWHLTLTVAALVLIIGAAGSWKLFGL